MEKKFMELAYKEAEKAFNYDEVPVGCVIVKNNKVIASAHNMKEFMKDATCHAEILAIRKASKYLNDWRLDDCILYTTVEPCEMCMGAIRESRIARVVYSVESSRMKKYYKVIEISFMEYMKDKSLNLLKSFFEGKRK